jgi:hypothetical protein
MSDKLIFKDAFDEFVDRDNVAQLTVYPGVMPPGITFELYKDLPSGDIETFVFCLSSEDAAVLGNYLSSLYPVNQEQ